MSRLINFRMATCNRCGLTFNGNDRRSHTCPPKEPEMKNAKWRVRWLDWQTQEEREEFCESEASAWAYPHVGSKVLDVVRFVPESALLEAFTSGQKSMQERAANIADEHKFAPTIIWGRIRDAIAALPLLTHEEGNGDG